MDEWFVIHGIGCCRWNVVVVNHMRKLSQLHEEFIDKARRPMTFGALPVVSVNRDVPIIASNKWEKVESPTRLRKKFQFMSQEDRNTFVRELLDYEDEVKHNATITVQEDEVVLDVRTKDIDQITEIDKEYAKHADELYRDVVYSTSHD